MELVVKHDETRELRAKFIKGNAPDKTVPCTIQKLDSAWHFFHLILKFDFKIHFRFVT
jgi:hypothetical protein